MCSDEEWLIKWLNETLNSDQKVRTYAELSLLQASLQPCFGSALVKVAANRDIPFGLRQLSAVLLKQFVNKHWQKDEETFEHPLASCEEKAVIRRLLLLSLDDPQKKICTAVGMAIASIAQYDWPEEWPELLPLLLKLMNDQSNMNGVHGALRCLTLISGDLDDTVVPTLVPVLFPCLHTIVSSPHIYDKNLRAKALSIVHSCTSILGTMSGVYKTETGALLNPMIPAWMDQFSKILEPPVQSEDPDDWCLRMEVLKCLNQFIQNFPSLTDMQFVVVAGPLWKTYISSHNVYERSSVEGTDDSYEGRYDSDGADQSLEAFVIQMFELLLTVLGTAKLGKVMASNIKELAYYTIGFLQITEQQVHTWSLDANQYVADEDENTYNCRVSGSLLLEEVVNSCGTNAIEAIILAARERFAESQQAKVAGSAAWWKMREATLFALASLSDQLLEVEDSGQTGAALGNLLEQMISEDTGTGLQECPFLYARLFSTIPKFTSKINHRVVEHILYSAIKAISMDLPPPVKVGACHAVSELLPEANKAALQSHMLGLFSSLADLLNQASDETMHLVLETLQAAIKAGHEAAASIEPIISSIILNMWAAHVSDPFISIDVVEVLEAIKNVPGCIHPLVSRVLPHIGPVLSKPQQQLAGLVSGALDLVTMLLKNSPNDVVKALYDTCFDSIVRIVLQTDDHSEMQNGTECLATLIYMAKQEVLAWGVDPGFVMRSLLDVASRLLDPDLPTSGSLFMGSYILQLILHLPSQMAPHIRDLVTALVRRMKSSQSAMLRSSLILIFARLVHMSAPHVEQFIDLMISLPIDGHHNSFVYLMSEWTKHQGEIQGSYQIKVTTTALALLLSTRHVELGKINVQGQLIKSTAGITTRSKAKSSPDQWTSVLLPAKILALLADVLIEIQEQVSYDNDEDSDWEEIQAGDIEKDQELLYSGANASYSKPSSKYLEAMAKVVDEDEDDTEGDEFLNNADPLNTINLANYILEFVRNFSQSDRSLLDHLCQSLTKAQLNALRIAWNQ